MKTLVISNNFLSELSNNGKTLKYLFSDYHMNNLFWIYSTPLSSDLNCDVKNILVSPFSKKLSVSEGSINNAISDSRFQRFYFIRNLFKKISNKPLLFNSMKTARELIYRTKYNYIYRFILSECKSKKINKIIFVAGDFVFFHKLARQLSVDLSIPLHVFVTDDYILEYRKDASHAFRPGFFNNIILKNFKNTFSSSSKNFFISKKMKDVYRQVFGIDGDISFNATSLDFAKRPETKTKNKRGFSIRYFGSLHSGRYDALFNILKLAMLFNKDNTINIFFEVYTSSKIPKGKYSEFPSSLVRFIDPVSGDNYEKAIIEADALVFLESHDVRNLQNTWLSFSTKVLEYLYSNKPIIAYGPMDNPSVKELVSNGAAIHIESKDDFNSLFCSETIEEYLLNSLLLKDNLIRENKLF